LETSARCE